jgi:GTPase
MTTSPATRCGFIAVVGAPNAGKSTFVNHMVGAHVAIVTPKVQTTRNKILGIALHEQSQLAFIDTPGVFKAKERFEKSMVKAALGSVHDADVILLLVDAYKGLCDNTKIVIEALKSCAAHKILVINKVDKVTKDRLPPLAAELFAMDNFHACFMISALKGSGAADVKAYLAKHVPEDHWHYPEDQISDAPMRQIAAEITRESLFMRLKQEVPYSVAVDTESWEEKQDGSVKISQVIYVRTEGQKKIIIGDKGVMLRDIGKASRHKLRSLTGRTVHLFLFVKVAEKWKDNKEFYENIGLEY